MGPKAGAQAALPRRSLVGLDPGLRRGTGEAMLKLDPQNLSLDQLRDLWQGTEARLDDASMQRIAESAASVERIVAGGETVVLDEIDAGVGGETAHRVAGVLRRLAERAQVLTITHLPQIASVADQHLRVEKVPGDPTHTRIAALDDALAREVQVVAMVPIVPAISNDPSAMAG